MRSLDWQQHRCSVTVVHRRWLSLLDPYCQSHLSPYRHSQWGRAVSSYPEAGVYISLRCAPYNTEENCALLLAMKWPSKGSVPRLDCVRGTLMSWYRPLYSDETILVHNSHFHEMAGLNSAALCGHTFRFVQCAERFSLEIEKTRQIGDRGRDRDGALRQPKPLK